MEQYCVFGNPIKQSRSPFIHQAFALQTHQLISYKTQWVALEQFTQAVSQFRQEGGKGANVTLPFKEQALQICDHLTERAKKAGAVNTLSFIGNEIFGDNTDGLGLVQDLIKNQVTLKQAKILMLGAGGAARGVILPLLAQDPDCLVIANRTLSKANSLSKQFADKRIVATGFEQLHEYDETFDLIINATSASLSGNVPAIATSVVGINSVCYDMVYAQELTPFLVWAKKLHAKKTIDGLGMLVGQAAESFNIWRGVMPKAEEVSTSLRKKLNEN